ncbi:hypothetical protein HanRHA438_Chr01g0012311 [Helianthus annuus]|nr:hypothetical protein HanRHA438_Chr01g0012311 [Helianthus annuus]
MIQIERSSVSDRCGVVVVWVGLERRGLVVVQVESDGSGQVETMRGLLWFGSDRDSVVLVGTLCQVEGLGHVASGSTVAGAT